MSTSIFDLLSVIENISTTIINLNLLPFLKMREFVTELIIYDSEPLVSNIPGRSIKLRSFLEKKPGSSVEDALVFPISGIEGELWLRLNFNP